MIVEKQIKIEDKVDVKNSQNNFNSINFIDVDEHWNRPKEVIHLSEEESNSENEDMKALEELETTLKNLDEIPSDYIDKIEKQLKRKRFDEHNHAESLKF